MKNKKNNMTDTQPQEPTALALVEQQDLAKPEKDTKFANAAAKVLMDIVSKNNWAKKLGGTQAHLQYEAWQTVGKYYGYTVRTGEAEYIELGGVAGFRAKAKVINEITGIEVGGAEAFCMRDEGNWKAKPTFQLASMAQTRAGSKALRQILGFVVALAGYNPTPAEEMEGVHPIATQQTHVAPPSTNGNGKIWYIQKEEIKKLLPQKGYDEKDLMLKYDVTELDQLTHEQAATIISNLKLLPDKGEQEIDIDEVDTGIKTMGGNVKE